MSHTDTLTMTAPQSLVTKDSLLNHWQNHRALTRRVIEVFPEDKLFSYSVGGMRTFAELVYEFLGMAVPGAKGLATGKWEKWADAKKVETKKELLALWDNATEELNRIWPNISEERLMETDTAFGQWPGTGLYFVFYFIDNEIHHRAQAYVYLRTLGIEPPPFWERKGF